MTLDKAERERREGHQAGLAGDEWLHEAHTRIEELEEAWHAARLRIEELEAAQSLETRHLMGLAVTNRDLADQQHGRAEGYRRAAIILRDLLRDEVADYCLTPGCLTITPERHCRKHR